MAWRDNLQDASFRGVPFKYLPLTTQIGRRNVVHEYPQRDKPYAEDLGRKARQYQVEAVVLGRDYMAARDRLIQALEAKGAGRLVHPTLGTMDVVVTSASVTEDTARDGGCARFSLTFTEAGDIAALTVTNDTSRLSGKAADTAVAAAQTAFAGKFSLVPDAGALTGVDNARLGSVLSAIGEAAALANTVATVVSDGMAIINNVVAIGEGLVSELLALPAALLADATGLLMAAVGDCGPLLDVISAVADLIDVAAAVADALDQSGNGAVPTASVPGLALASNITAARSALPITAASPALLASTLTGVVQGFGNTSSPGLSQSPMLAIADRLPAADGSGGTVAWTSLPTGIVSGSTVSEGTGDTSGAGIITAQQPNRQAMADLVRQVAVIETVRQATSRPTPYATADDALAARDDLAARLDAEALASSDYALNAALRGLRAALVEDIDSRAAALPSLVKVTPPTVLPALVLAHRFYDDPSRAAEIVSRNRIDRPGFVPVTPLTMVAPS